MTFLRTCALVRSVQGGDRGIGAADLDPDLAAAPVAMQPRRFVPLCRPARAGELRRTRGELDPAEPSAKSLRYGQPDGVGSASVSGDRKPCVGFGRGICNDPVAGDDPATVNAGTGGPGATASGRRSPISPWPTRWRNPRRASLRPVNLDCLAPAHGTTVERQARMLLRPLHAPTPKCRRGASVVTSSAIVGWAPSRCRPTQFIAYLPRVGWGVVAAIAAPGRPPGAARAAARQPLDQRTPDGRRKRCRTKLWILARSAIMRCR